MMRRLALVFAFLGAATGGAAAQTTISVRSGEHGGYTRLVVQVPSGTSWRLTHRKNGASLSLGLTDVVFDMKSVFTRLSGNRLSGLTQAQPGAPLEMEFGCDCAATAFLFKGTMVVVDIAPGKALPLPDLDIPPPVLPRLDKAAPPEDLPLTHMAEPLLRLSRQDIESRLATRFVQSADREIVDLDLAGVGPRASTPPPPTLFAPDLSLNLAITSVLDELGSMANLPLPILEPGPACISDAALDFESWTDGRPFDQQVADLRRALFQEFDRIDPDAAIKLAEVLTYFGFGAEAVQTLGLLSQVPEEAEWVSGIATVIDALPSDGPPPFEGLQRCDGAIALWAALAQGELQPEARPEIVEQSFQRLPEHLRRHLGPRLAQIFTKAEELEAARRILRSVERIEPEVSAETNLAKAQVASAAEDTQSSRTLLNKVIEDPKAQVEAPLALARLIEQQWADRGAITQSQLDLAGAYAVELKNSELGPVMARSHAVALSLFNEFEPAFRLSSAHVGDADWDGTQNRILQLLAERADDGTFVGLTFAMDPSLVQHLSTDTALALAERYADLGFASQVRRLVDKGQDRTRQRDRAWLRARVAMMEGLPRQALEELADDRSERSQRLRAAALTELGEYDEAAQILAELGEEAEAARLAWLAGSPKAQTDRPDGRVGRLMDLSAALDDPAERSPESPLKDARTLLETSTGTRDTIRDLLALVETDAE